MNFSLALMLMFLKHEIFTGYKRTSRGRKQKYPVIPQGNANHRNTDGDQSVNGVFSLREMLE